MRPPVAILSAIAATLLVTTLGQGQDPEAAVAPIVISDVKISDTYKQVAIRDGFGDPQTRTNIRPLPTRKLVFTIPRGADVNELKLRHREDVPEPLPKEVKKETVKRPPPPPAKDKEALAAELLKKAEAVAAANPTLARVRCEEILRLYPTTKAAGGARKLLEQLAKKRDTK